VLPRRSAICQQISRPRMRFSRRKGCEPPKRLGGPYQTWFQGGFGAMAEFYAYGPG